MKSDCINNYCLNFRIVRITLCDKANNMSEPQFIAKMQEITNKSKMVRHTTVHTPVPAVQNVMPIPCPIKILMSFVSQICHNVC